MTPRSIVAGY